MTKRYLDFLIDLSFLGVNRLFVLSFEKKDDRTVSTKYCLPTVETKDYNFMINGENFFDGQLKMISEHMIKFKKLQLVKEMIALLVVCWTKITSQIITKSSQ